MGAKLRRWMRSWRVWVTVGCLVYIGLARGQGPRIVAVWPAGLWVAQGLLLLALLFVGWIVTDAVARYVAVPFLTFLEGKPLDRRTAKAQEMFADSLMSLSTAVVSAVLIGLLVFPFTAFIQAIAGGIDPVAALVSWWQPDRWSWWHVGLFLLLYWLPLSMALLLRRRALDVYDMIASPASVVEPTAQGTPERSDQDIGTVTPEAYEVVEGGTQD
jgi:hypothetical protein